MKNPRKVSRPTARDFNSGTPEYEAEQLNIRRNGQLKRRGYKAGHTRRKSVPRNRFHITGDYGFIGKPGSLSHYSV